MRKTKVRFIESKQGALTALEVDAPAEHPLSQTLANQLRGAGLRVVRRKTTVGGGQAYVRVKVAELNGTPVSGHKRLEVQALLLAFAAEESGARYA